MKKWYLSFSLDGQALGCCIVEGETLGEAIRQAWMLGINPGGAVAATELKSKIDFPLNRLLSRAELNRLNSTPSR